MIHLVVSEISTEFVLGSSLAIASEIFSEIITRFPFQILSKISSNISSEFEEFLREFHKKDFSENSLMEKTFGNPSEKFLKNPTKISSQILQRVPPRIS